MYYVYILKSKKDSKHYIGYTNDLRRRLDEHNNGKSKSTKHRIPFELIYYEAYAIKSSAIRREKKLKKFKNSYSRLMKRIYNE
jgi:putative endonuclease